MKINIYAVCLVILCGSQVYASAPAAQQAATKAPETPRAGWVEVVHVSPKTALKMIAMNVVLQVRASQLESAKRKLAETEAAAARLKKYESVIEAYEKQLAKEKLEGDLKYQNDPSRFGLFHWENN